MPTESPSMHKVFISYHHARDQWFKNQLVALADAHDTFIDRSVDKGDIDDTGLSDETIRQKIRDEYLRDSTVTIVLVGKETKSRNHVDWEIYSSMYDGAKNKKSGIIAVTLEPESIRAPHGEEEKRLYPDISRWTSSGSYKELHPDMPPRIADNKDHISVTNWGYIEGKEGQSRLKCLIDIAEKKRSQCDYDMSVSLRGRNL